METSIPVVVATISQSLAIFIKQELAETNTAVHLLTDPDLFFKQLKRIKPGIILLDANYPTGEKSAGLARDLRQKSTWKDIPLVVIKTFFEPLEETFPEISTENILTQPFTRSDLLTILQRLTPQAIDNHKQVQNMTMQEETKKVEESTGAANQPEGIIELTEIVEEGLPLDQLPSTEEETDIGTEMVTEPVIETPTDTKGDELEFLSDETIDGLDFDSTETMAVQSEESPADYLVSDKDELPESTESEVLPSHPAATTKAMGADSIDSDQMEENLVEQTIEKTLETDSKAETVPEDFTTERLEDYLTPDEEKPGNENTIGADSIDTDQMEEDLVEQTIEKTLETDSKTETAPEDLTTENPENNLTPDEEKPRTSLDTPMAAEPETARPSVVTEPQTADFSRQIEGLTQEWSKKMLVSTYASMDKLIQALGDMAPSIVEQVAREIIPPLAEKIIKSEIQRLEEKIEDDLT